MSFPKVVNVQPAIAVEGDFASANSNKFSVIAGGAGSGAYLTGPNGLNVGAFAWADPTNTILTNSGSGPVLGFISREGLRADILTPGPSYPDASMTILPGSYITVFNAGDFYVRNYGSTTSAVGNKVYANFVTGLASFAPTGNPPTAASISSGSVTANTIGGGTVAVNAFTGSIAPASGAGPAVLTVSAITTGGIYPGQVIASANVDPNTTILAQLTGTAGSTGTYSVSISQTVAAGTAFTGSGGWLHVTSMTNGVVYPGQTLSGGSNAFTAGTTVLVGGTGVGVAGFYPVSIAQTLASVATATGSGGYLTVTTLTSGALNPGDTVTSTSGSSFLLPFGTGGTTGVGLGGGTTYVLSNATEAGDTSFTVVAGVETKWTAYGVGAPGELVAISSTSLG